MSKPKSPGERKGKGIRGDQGERGGRTERKIANSMGRWTYRTTPESRRRRGWDRPSRAETTTCARQAARAARGGFRHPSAAGGTAAGKGVSRGRWTRADNRTTSPSARGPHVKLRVEDVAHSAPLLVAVVAPAIQVDLVSKKNKKRNEKAPARCFPLALLQPAAPPAAHHARASPWP